MKFHLAKIKSIDGKKIKYIEDKAECNKHSNNKRNPSIIDNPSEFHKYYKKYPKDACIHCLNAASKLWPKAFN